MAELGSSLETASDSMISFLSDVISIFLLSTVIFSISISVSFSSIAFLKNAYEVDGKDTNGMKTANERFRGGVN